MCVNQGKVADLGLSRRLGLSESIESDGYGPVAWMALESLQPPFVFSRATDSYMFGVLMWETFESVDTANVCRPWGSGMTRPAVVAKLASGGWLSACPCVLHFVYLLVSLSLCSVSVCVAVCAWVGRAQRHLFVVKWLVFLEKCSPCSEISSTYLAGYSADAGECLPMPRVAGSKVGELMQSCLSKVSPEGAAPS